MSNFWGAYQTFGVFLFSRFVLCFSLLVTCLQKSSSSQFRVLYENPQLREFFPHAPSFVRKAAPAMVLFAAKACRFAKKYLLSLFLYFAAYYLYFVVIFG